MTHWLHAEHKQLAVEHLNCYLSTDATTSQMPRLALLPPKLGKLLGTAKMHHTFHDSIQKVANQINSSTVTNLISSGAKETVQLSTGSKVVSTALSRGA